MSLLQNIKRGVQQRPQRVIIYGPEGVGKSTLAAGLPAPVLLDTEQGSSHIDVARLDCRNYGDVINAIEELTQGGHEFRTVIIDSIDWCERLFVNAFIREHNKRANASLKSIEDFGYGKGYKMIEPVAMDLLSRLNALMSAGMNVVLVGHSRRVKFEMPETAGAYDKHELNLSKFVAPLVKEWADAMLFCNFVVTVQDGKGHGGNQRMVYTSPSAPWEAKNRHGMPAVMAMDAGEISRLLFGAGCGPSGNAPAGEKQAPPPAQQEKPAPSLADQLAAVINDVPGALNFLAYKKEIQPGQGLEAVSEKFASFILSAPDRFNTAVLQYNTPAGPGHGTLEAVPAPQAGAMPLLRLLPRCGGSGPAGNPDGRRLPGPAHGRRRIQGV